MRSVHWVSGAGASPRPGARTTSRRRSRPMRPGQLCPLARQARSSGRNVRRLGAFASSRTRVTTAVARRFTHRNPCPSRQTTSASKHRAACRSPPAASGLIPIGTPQSACPCLLLLRGMTRYSAALPRMAAASSRRWHGCRPSATSLRRETLLLWPQRCSHRRRMAAGGWLLTGPGPRRRRAAPPSGRRATASCGAPSFPAGNCMPRTLWWSWIAFLGTDEAAFPQPGAAAISRA